VVGFDIGSHEAINDKFN